MDSVKDDSMLEDNPDHFVMRNMIRDAENQYNTIEKPKFHRVLTGNDPKGAGLDCTDFQPTDMPR